MGLQIRVEGESTSGSEPEVTRVGLLDMQVCVPESWNDEQVVGFANAANPSGIANKWFIRTDPKLLAGDPIRQPCDDRAGHIHVMLDI